jgi:hypothetical protein
MSDVVPAEERPHRVSAESGLDPDPESTGIDPRNLAQGAGRFDDDEHAARVAESQEATAEAAATARGETAEPSYSYTADDVPETAADVVSWIRQAESDADRAARVEAAGAKENAREDGTRSTVTDELER